MNEAQLDYSAAPFRCDSLPLSIALAARGCQFANADGRILAGLNQYSAAFIRAQVNKTTGEPLCAGMTHEAAVRYLWKSGVPGNVVWFFERTPKLHAVCKGWDAEPDAVHTDPDAAFGAAIKAYLTEHREFVGAKGVTAFWRRRDPNGIPYVAPIRHDTGTVTSESHGDKTSTIIRNAAQVGVSV